MLPFSWRSLSSGRGRRGRSGSPRPRPRPGLERLEDRSLPAAVPLFGLPTDISLGTGISHPNLQVAVGDFNGDGKPDLAVVDGETASVQVLINTTPTGAATPTFAAAPIITLSGPADGPALSVAVGDFNNDSLDDIAVSSQSSSGNGAVSVLINTTTTPAAAATFATPLSFAAGPDATSSDPVSLAVGDFDGDGKLDLAWADLNQPYVGVALNTTDTTMHPPMVSFAAPQAQPVSGPAQALAVGDFDGDGKDDLAVTTAATFPAGSNILSTHENFIGTVFQSHDTFSVPVNEFTIATTEFGIDTKPDLVVAGSGGTSLLTNDGTGKFSAGSGPAQSGSSAVVAADFDGDGNTDLAFGINGTGANGQVVVFRGPSPATATVDPYPLDFSQIGSMAVADFNGDGLPDLVVGNAVNPQLGGGGIKSTGGSVTGGGPGVAPALNIAVLLNQTGTQTQVIPSANSVPEGQPVVFTATVSPTFAGAGTPTGMVQFRDGNTVLGSDTLSTVGGVQEAVLSTSFPSAIRPDHMITAVYVSYNGFHGSISPPVMVTVIPSHTLTIIPASLPAATEAISYSQTLVASGAVGTARFALIGGLPAGLQLSRDGVLSGLPTTPTGATPVTFIITATDDSGATVTQTYSLAVNSLGTVVFPKTTKGSRKTPRLRNVRSIILNFTTPIDLKAGDIQLSRVSGFGNFQVHYQITKTQVTISIGLQQKNGKIKLTPLPRGTYVLTVNGVPIKTFVVG
jgi:hypothetical protein